MNVKKDTLKTMGLHLLILLSCSEKSIDQSFHVVVRIDEFPQTKSPLNYTSLETQTILNLVYNSLEEIDKVTNEVRPGVGTLKSIIDSGDLKIFKYDINSLATWGNREHRIDGSDISFSIKVSALPNIDNQRSRVGQSYIKRIVWKDSTSEFEIHAIGNNENLRPRIGQFYILPQHFFDPEGLLHGLGYEKILEESHSVEVSRKISKYAEYYDSPELRDEISTGGSGPYEITSWIDGSIVTLEKNNSWWGHKLAAQNSNFTYNPDRIIYRLISEESIALIALKNGEIDVLPGISPTAFTGLRAESLEGGNDTSNYHFLTPVSYQFFYVGFNPRRDRFNYSTRNALSHLIPYEDIIETAALGFGQRTVGPMNPVDTQYYNHEIEMVDYDEEKAAAQLIESGYRQDNGQWKNSDGQPLTLDLLYPTGSGMTEDIALIMKDAFRKFGIDLTLSAMERTQLLQRARSHDFEMVLSSFRGGPLAHNFAPLFSTEAAKPGGLNFTGFGSEESDNVINQINYAEKKEQKVSGLKELQRMLHEEKTMLFLFFEKTALSSASVSRMSTASVDPQDTM